jgi:hypothetical protein
MYSNINYNLNGDSFIKNAFEVVLKRNPSEHELFIYKKEVEQNSLYEKKQFSHKLIQCDEFLNNYLITKIYDDKKNIENLKVCFLICGHWRESRKYIEKYQKFFLKNKNIDIFVHTWSEQSNDIFHNIISKIKPKSLLIESNDQILNSFNWEIKNKDKSIFGNIGYVLNYGDYSKYIISQLYGIYKCNEMKKNYEKINNIKYDLVIKVRADMFIDFDLNNMKKLLLTDDILYIYNDNNHRHPLHGGGCAGCMINYPEKKCTVHENLICDIMVYGKSEALDLYTEMYNYHDDILKYFHNHNKEEKKKCFSFEHSHEMFYRTSNIESEEMNFKCCYPEHFLKHHLKDKIVLSDPFKFKAELK